MSSKRITKLIPFLLAFCILLAGCGTENNTAETAYSTEPVAEAAIPDKGDVSDGGEESADPGPAEEGADEGAELSSALVSLSDIPEYSGSAYVEVNGNIPEFDAADKTATSFETYSELDSLGRCGAAYANIGQDLMPTEGRESISSVTPTGWINHEYDSVDGGWLWNRCHLIGYQLTAENANELNLITGSRYMNVEGMLPFENMVADYIKETGNHVLYRVTPVFEGDNLVASGVLMEAWSVEDGGDGVCFSVYCYNVQPGISIDYATGENYATGESGENGSGVELSPAEGTESTSEDTSSDTGEEGTYILNTNTMKFHDPSCSSVSKMSETNKEEYTGIRQKLTDEGYEPCGICNP